MLLCLTALFFENELVGIELLFVQMVFFNFLTPKLRRTSEMARVLTSSETEQVVFELLSLSRHRIQMR